MEPSLFESVRRVLGERMAVWERDGYSIVATPWRLEDGTPVTVYVSHVSGQFYDVTDAGMAASFLADAGVDLKRKNAREPFQSIRDRLALPPTMARGNEWDIAGSAEESDLGEAVIAVAESVHDAQILRALGRKYRPQGVKERILKTANQLRLDVEPNANMPLKVDDQKRRVNFRIHSDGRNQAFLQSVTEAGAMTSYDHARSLFSDSAIEQSALVTVLERDLRLERWQLAGLSEVSQVVPEEELHDFLRDKVAA